MAEKSEYALPDAACLLPENEKTAPDALRLALKLSAQAYDMDAGPWLDAGWQDLSFQVDDLLLTGFKSRRACEQAASKARARLEKADPFSQFRVLRKQKEALEACKALVMAHPLPGGRYCVAIAFTGSTRRLQDWLGNLQLEEEEGFHAGFLQLTKQFEQNAGGILFPQMGSAVGREKLSLLDILADLRAGSRRHFLFVTGHSQGAALMQLYVYRLIESGVPPRQVQGVGFASPCVAMQRQLSLASSYPVVNIINADDVVARIGGRMHIGMCRVLPATAEYRRACYGRHADTRLVRDVLLLEHQVRNTQDALLMGIALMEKIALLPDIIGEEALALFTRGLLPDLLMQRLTGYARRMAASAARRLRAKCEKLQGAVDEKRLLVLQRSLDRLIEKHGARESVMTICEMLVRPHALSDRAHPRAYQIMVTTMQDRLVSSLWMDQETPVWDQKFGDERRGRKLRCAYNRFRPLHTQRRRSDDHV